MAHDPQGTEPPLGSAGEDGLDPAELFAGAMAKSSTSRTERWVPPSPEEVQRMLPGYQVG